MQADVPSLSFNLDRLQTPIGAMLVVTDCAGRLRAADFGDYEHRMHQLLRQHYAKVGAVTLTDGRMPPAVRAALEAYFSGDLKAIDRIDVATGGTEFQRKIWTALRGIPVGETVTYGLLANQVGAPKAVRAVGAANGANPVSIVVPCHRVIGADASLTGYGGGIARKSWLLTHEGAAFKAPK